MSTPRLDPAEVIKPILITDPVHGSIPITRLEKEVMSLQLFNRLHNVLQNSTALYTYPANRTSRFSHSIGVMHVAGEIYYRSVLNADVETQSRFLDDLYAEVQDVMRLDAFRAETAYCLGPDFLAHEALDGTLVTSDIDVVYQDYLPRLPGRDALLRGYLVGFEAIRLVGLLHDVGHPPLSHIAEFAIGELREEINERGPRTTRERSFIAILDKVAPGNLHIHEGVGNEIAKALLSRAVADIWKRDPGKPQRTLFYLLCEHLALRILQSDQKGDDAHPSRFAGALHSIVSSDFDADRLDYVTRDSLASGISTEPFRYERLRNGLRLVYAKAPDQKPTPRFLPSVRALSDLERFYRLRQDLYKYVIYHHRVVRTDGLMKESIRELAREHLHSDKGVDELPPHALIPADISGLWTVLDVRRQAVQREYIDQYIQWDDAWLITMLRREYFAAVAKREMGKVTDRSLLEMMLSETVSNRRFYFSLFKGIDSFIAVDDSFVKALPCSFELSSLLEDKDRLSPGVVEQEALVDQFIKCSRDGTTPLYYLREQHGFFVCCVRELWQRAWKTGTGGSLGFVCRAAGALVQEFAQTHGLRDALVMPKTLKRGLDDRFLLHDDGIPLRLREVSRLVRDLDINATYFPPFWVYVAAESRPTDVVIESLCRAFGRHLAAAFVAEQKGPVAPYTMGRGEGHG